MKHRTVFLLTALLISVAPVLADSSRVNVVVNSDLYAQGSVTTALNVYLADIQAQGYEPVLTTTPFSDAAALRSHLAAMYNGDGLAGAVFVGDQPSARFEIPAHGDWKAEDFPTDLYYQDMDGLWTDSDANGIYDSHSGQTAPEIWMGRIQTHQLVDLHPGRTEAAMLNTYLAKDHAYRTGHLRISPDALVYADNQWTGYEADRRRIDLMNVARGEIVVADDVNTTTAEDYLNHLHREFEHVILLAHSNETIHEFDKDSDNRVYSSDLEQVNPQALFYNLYACESADYTTDGYLAGEYVFGAGLGLIATGSTKVGSMRQFEQYYRPLGFGDTFGEAMQAWWELRANGGFTDSERDWYYGMTMIGDPLLMTQHYTVPEPTTMTLLAVTGVLLAARKRHIRAE